ncbi:DmsC/YnfH family molybdoenzyme membrane anchor subunit [Allorhodopirellula heiligendammensis]|uniref:Anaerobic dimethyl sulfoxide reductase chain B n=1 Tax=Allorhodopirellula heiligendammensis TaxID=2714739 RepID=A0A5C6C1A6_9BACT|nr:DmsC/YnfH family molybdoenzyme membrane anchor subunit [Allorhodopirellula heiligendammensis]TWU17912.1 Anaerobic dimethyl sulfoxide reductase chain B [Allorhodopirellula heiligendammensis]
MSTTLPPEPNTYERTPSAGAPLSFSGNEFDLVGMLLEQQQSLTAVEQFSEAHESGRYGSACSAPSNEPLQSIYYRRLMPATPPQPGQQLAFEVNLDTCSGCKACVVACHTMNGLEDDESWRKVGTLIIGAPESPAPDAITAAAPEPSPVAIDLASAPVVGIQHVTTACHHCEDPGCLNGCPVKAYVKDEVTGIVKHLDDQCIGCKYCTMMCPYEVPKYSKRLGIVRKCDMCHQRLKAGEAPACVQSCPNESIAIRIVDRSAAVDDHDESLMPEAPSSSLTRPTTQYIGQRSNHVALATPQDSAIDEVAESHWPLAIMLVATQVAVGMILVEQLVSLALSMTGATMPRAATRLTASVALVITMIGMNLAPLHLGQPLRAWRVFLGLRTSWLSREAVLLGKFAAALTIATVLLWLPIWKPWVPDFVIHRVPEWVTVPGWATAAAMAATVVFGLAGVYSSAMIYIVTRRELWRSSRTLPRFLSTGLIVGASLTATTIGWAGGSDAVVILLLITAVLSGATKLFWELSFHLGASVELATVDRLDIRSQNLVASRLGHWRQLRLGAGWGGLVACMVAVCLIGVGEHAAGLLLALVGSLTLLVAESAERLLYFMSIVYYRMPGTLK